VIACFLPGGASIAASYDFTMLPRIPGLVVLFTALCSSLAGPVCLAQETGKAEVRYHFGDDPRWADPGFDDRSWPTATQGRWALPAFQSDGFVWVRARVPVPKDAAGLLAFRETKSLEIGRIFTFASETFVNGHMVGRQGNLPPDVELKVIHPYEVFELPPGLTAAGDTATIAVRVWYPPLVREMGGYASGEFEIDQSRNLHLASRADFFSDLVSAGLNLALNALIAVLGIGLLILWRWAGGRDVLLCGALLAVNPLFNLLLIFSDGGLVSWSWLIDCLLWALARTVCNWVMFEFVWAIHNLGGIGFKRLVLGYILIFNGCLFFDELAVTPSSAVYWSALLSVPASEIFILVLVGANLWAFFTRKRNRMIAAVLVLYNATLLTGWLGFQADARIGPFHFDTFSDAFYITAVALFVMLGQRTWQAWRIRDESRVELEAAREVQQQLVVPAVNLPGFQIESAYLPARQVGGDFFRILPDGAGGVLIVVGDVSGKGLKAAMTVSAIMGSLHDYSSSRPAEVLAHLNRVLYGRVGGFVTCSAAHIGADGWMMLANAGNPAPYRNGEEVAVEPGLPLGMVGEVSYAETRYRIAAGDRLTFVSDGVVEATNAQGELYGFERTQAISGKPAKTIAEAAAQFGQEDDITVLTFTRLSVEEPGRGDVDCVS